MQIEFKMHGLAQLTTALRTLGPEIASKVGDQAVRAGANVILEEAKRLVPVRTGELRDNMVVRVVRNPRHEGKRVALIGWKDGTGRRAHLTEMGTRFAKAQPFLRPALDTKQEDAFRAMVKALARGVAREANKVARGRR